MRLLASLILSGFFSAGVSAKVLRPADPAPYRPATTARQPARINFNGLIRRSGHNERRLAKRVKIKTSRPAHKKKKKIAAKAAAPIPDGDIALRRVRRPAAKTPPRAKISSASADESFALVLRRKSSR
jgi:hypothetical protein